MGWMTRMRSWRRTVVAAACQSEGLWLEMLTAPLWVSSEVASQLKEISLE